MLNESISYVPFCSQLSTLCSLFCSGFFICPYSTKNKMRIIRAESLKQKLAVLSKTVTRFKKVKASIVKINIMTFFISIYINICFGIIDFWRVRFKHRCKCEIVCDIFPKLTQYYAYSC